MWRRDNKNYVTTELVCWCESVRFASFGALFYENMLVRRLMTVFGVFIYELLRQPKATVRPIERTKRMRNDTRKERTEKHTRCIRTGDGYWFSLFWCLLLAHFFCFCWLQSMHPKYMIFCFPLQTPSFACILFMRMFSDCFWCAVCVCLLAFFMSFSALQCLVFSSHFRVASVTTALLRILISHSRTVSIHVSLS